jgi:hypothetical protein
MMKNHGREIVVIVIVVVTLIAVYGVLEPSVPWEEYRSATMTAVRQQDGCQLVSEATGFALDETDYIPFWIRYHPLRRYYKPDDPFGGLFEGIDISIGRPKTATDIYGYECAEGEITIQHHIIDNRACAVTIYHPQKAAKLVQDIRNELRSGYPLFPIKLVPRTQDNLPCHQATTSDSAAKSAFRASPSYIPITECSISISTLGYSPRKMDPAATRNSGMAMVSGGSLILSPFSTR